MRARKGFTLIEMMVVLAIVGLLAAAARPLLVLSVQRSQESALRDALRSLRGAIDAYKRAADLGQVARSADSPGYPPNLRALVDGVADIRSPTGGRVYFLRRLPRDPFADASLPAEETWGLRASDSPPDEPRQGRDVFDVFSTSGRRALDGSWLKDW
ncbi:MAG TPA: type II secretion system protein [Burkholderiaceae bacterium]